MKMRNEINSVLFFVILAAILSDAVSTITDTPANYDNEELDEESPSTEVDDEGRIYKNPRNSPSSECPRDEEQATILGQKCLRKCSSDEDCKSKRKKCICDGVCGMSCIKPDRECPELAQPLLGQVLVVGKHFGAKALYSCPKNYHVVGLQSRLCQADGNWAGAEPACKQNIYCLVPPQIEHARHSALPEQETFDLDSTVQYHCHAGYVTNGFPRAKCLAIDGLASWYGPDIQCEPRSCGQPPDPAYGWHAGECYTYGCKIIYNCGIGYELVGKQERHCQSDGSWTPKELPTCVLICPTPDNPKNGKATFTTLAYNSVVSYECRYGYTLVGDSSSRCGAERKWSGILPTCKEINCGNPGILYNGWIQNIEAGTGLGATLVFRCFPGMLLQGHSSSVCQIDGRWRNVIPECLAPCIVPKISQGSVIPIDNNSEENTTTEIEIVASSALSIVEKVKHGTILEVKCQEHYEFPVSLLSFPTCINGTWSVIPRCVPARCKTMPKPPRHGMVLAPKIEHGMKARFRCKDGFKLISPGGKDVYHSNEYILTCSFGKWTGDVPHCQEVFCSFPGYIPNGKVLLVGNMGLYDYRPYVKKIVNNKQIMYDCDKGYVLETGPPGATCVGGKWRPIELPQCLLGQHPRLRWNRRRRSIKLRYLRSLYLKWNNRLKRKLEQKKQSYIRAQSKIFIQKETLKSQIVKRKKRSNEEINFDNGKKRLRGSCEDLDWNSFANVIIIKAGKGPGRNSAGSVIRFECNAGFRLNVNTPNATSKCVRGSWKPYKPECESAPCLVPTVNNGNYFKLDPGDTLLFNNLSSNILPTYAEVKSFDAITLMCEEGYKIQGSPQLKCAHGSWTVNAFSECLPMPCNLPSIQNLVYEGGYRAGLTIAHGSSVDFRCESIADATVLQMFCSKGVISPKEMSCENVSRRAREEFLSGNELIQTVGLFQNVTKTGSNNENTEAQNNTEEGIKVCGPPSRVEGALIYKNSDEEYEEGYASGTEIYFNCIASVAGERNTWKIICENGHWIGRSYNCANGTCIFRNNEPNVISFYNDLEIREDVVEFPPGATIISRCIDIGKYALTGSTERTCIHSEWTGTKPTCFGLNQENDYAMEKAPTILFRHQNGPIAQSNDGKLIVFPGTTLHMECLWMRRFGNPKWNVSHDFRIYQEGWVTDADEGRDIQLEYRLSIFNAVENDSGIYTCQTPARHEHSVEVVVRAIDCPDIPSRRGLIVSNNDTKLSSRVLLSCANGNSLIGTSELFCLPSGNWSAPLPVCESVECGDIPVSSNLSSPRVAVLSREIGGRAAFSCASGYGLRGPSEAVCLPSGEWALPFPMCVEVQCDDPGAPQNGYAQGSAPYRAGDVVQFNCNPEFMMQGQPIIACQDNGRWSGGLPRCVQACSYPGTAISGRMSSVKFYYAIGESISFTCDAGLELRGAKMLKCLRNGKWSNAIPTCINTEAFNNGGTAVG